MSKILSDCIKVNSIVKPADMEYYINFDNPKEKKKFIDRCERVIRSSLEYKDYIKFLKENCDMTQCAFFNHINSKEMKRVKIEIHHEPFTLYDYVTVVVDRMINDGEKLNDLLVADEVMALHYENMVGLIPLTKTIHQIIHSKESNKLLIPINLCYGNYMAFLQKYEGKCSDEVIDALYDKLEEKIDYTKELTKESFDAIMKEFTYLDIQGQEEVEKIPIDYTEDEERLQQVMQSYMVAS